MRRPHTLSIFHADQGCCTGATGDTGETLSPHPGEPRSGEDEPFADGIAHQPSGVVNIQLFHHPAAVKLSRLHTDLERSEEHTSELQSQSNLVCRLLLEKKKKK